MAEQLGAAEYQALLKALMPQGLAWSGPETEKLLSGWADELARLDSRSHDLVNELDPNTTQELLLDWERLLGLPEPCTQLGQSVQARRAAIIAKLRYRGQQTKAFLIELAALIGYTVTIEELTPFTCGVSSCGQALTIDRIRYFFEVYAPLDTIRYFRTGTNTSGDPLRDFGNDDLECIINHHKPAHTTAVFIYQDPPPEPLPSEPPPTDAGQPVGLLMALTKSDQPPPDPGSGQPSGLLLTLTNP